MSAASNCNAWLNAILPALSPQANFKQCCAPNSFMQCTPQNEILSIDLNPFAAQINGHLPTEFTQLTKLQILRISGTKLSGPIPTEFGQFTTLSFLDLSNNQLTGQVPDSLGALTSNQIPLQTLNLQGNPGLSGPLNPLLKEKLKSLNADPAVLNAPPGPTKNETTPASTNSTVNVAGSPNSTTSDSSALVVGVVVSVILSILVFGTVFYLQRRKPTPNANRNSQFWVKGA